MRDPPVSSDHVSLAYFTVFQGKYQEAGPCVKRSLAIRETIFGPDHPAVAESLNDWAGVLIKQVMFSLGSWERAFGSFECVDEVDSHSYCATTRPGSSSMSA